MDQASPDSLYIKTDTYSWVIPIVENDGFWLFVIELDNRNMVVEYIVNESYNKIYVHPHEYMYFRVEDWAKVKFLKILINKNHILNTIYQIWTKEKDWFKTI